MKQILNLDDYPIDQPQSAAYADLVSRCKKQLAEGGLFNLVGFLRDGAVDQALSEVKPKIATEAFTHSRAHNIYFRPSVKGLADDHPALAKFQTTNHTICADQIEGSIVTQIYDWAPLPAFLADVMDKPALYPMDDRIACANVMTYYNGEALNWHFDRSEFTTTLLLQAPKAGGDFEYVQDLRSATDPNYDGVANLCQGMVPTQLCPQDPGTLNVFKGVNTAHRVTPVQGDTPRINVVLTYYQQPGRKFTEEERLGFYGRAK